VEELATFDGKICRTFKPSLRTHKKRSCIKWILLNYIFKIGDGLNRFIVEFIEGFVCADETCRNFRPT
jgi:hypothetical protein